MPIKLFLQLALAAIPFAFVIASVSAPYFPARWPIAATIGVIGFVGMMLTVPREWRPPAITLAFALGGVGSLMRVLSAALRVWTGETPVFSTGAPFPAWALVLWSLVFIAPAYLQRRAAT